MPSINVSSAVDTMMQAASQAAVRHALGVAGPVFDVASYGAVAGTGVSSGQATTNTSLIQAAIDAAEAAGGGIVWFPGIFNIDSHVTVDGSGVTLACPSMNFDFGLRQITGTADIVRWNGADFGGINNMTLRYAAQATGGTALRLDGLVASNAFRNIYIWQSHTGIGMLSSGTGTDPTGEFSNTWENIRIQAAAGGAMRSFIRLEHTNSSGTGSVWSNIYCNGGNQALDGAGKFSSHGVYLRQHAGIWKQLNIEWGDFSANQGYYPLLVHGNGGVTVESVHFEGNTLANGGTLISTFGTSPPTSLRLGTVQVQSTKATTGTVSIVEAGAATKIRIDKIVLPIGFVITPVATFNVFGGDQDDASTYVELAELLDPSSQIDGVLGAGYTAGTYKLPGALEVANGGTGAATAAAARTNLLAVGSDIAGITGADAITNIVSLTQAEYDALGVKSATTLYIITG